MSIRKIRKPPVWPLPEETPEQHRVRFLQEHAKQLTDAELDHWLDRMPRDQHNTTPNPCYCIEHNPCSWCIGRWERRMRRTINAPNS